VLLLLLLAGMTDKGEDQGYPAREARYYASLQVSDTQRARIMGMIAHAIDKKKTQLTLFSLYCDTKHGTWTPGLVGPVRQRQFLRTFASAVAQGAPQRLKLKDFLVQLRTNPDPKAAEKFACLVDFLDETYYAWTLVHDQVQTVARPPRPAEASLGDRLMAALGYRASTIYDEYQLVVDFVLTRRMRRRTAQRAAQGLLFGHLGTSITTTDVSASVGVSDRVAGPPPPAPVVVPVPSGLQRVAPHSSTYTAYPLAVSSRHHGHTASDGDGDGARRLQHTMASGARSEGHSPMNRGSDHDNAGSAESSSSSSSRHNTEDEEEDVLLSVVGTEEEEEEEGKEKGGKRHPSKTGTTTTTTYKSTLTMSSSKSRSSPTEFIVTGRQKHPTRRNAHPRRTGTSDSGATSH
jgi:hypothetical protein